MESLISVIIPVYNTESYVRVCLESLVEQTYTNFEVNIQRGTPVFITIGKKMVEFPLPVIWGLNIPEEII